MGVLCQCPDDAAAEAFAGQATTEAVRLSPRPTPSEVASLLARADGRLVALLAETHAELDAFLAVLPADHTSTPLAVVPYGETDLRLRPAGAPTNVDNGVRLALTGAPAVAPVMRTDHGLATGEISLHHEDYTEVELQVSIDGEVAYRGLAISIHATLADDLLEISVQWVGYEPRRLFGRRRLSDFENYEGRQLWIDSQVALTMDGSAEQEPIPRSRYRIAYEPAGYTIMLSP